MAFCPSCGNSVLDNDRFCGNCGAAQPLTGAASGARASATWQDSTAATISPKNASLLCYLPWIGWIAALFVLATERFRTMRDVRFHAFQGLFLFVAWLLVSLATREIGHFPFPQVLKLAVFCTWIYMLVQTSNNRLVKLPLIGELAERSVDEQR